MLGIIACSSNIIPHRNVMLLDNHSLELLSNRNFLGSHQSMIVVGLAHQFADDFHIFAYNVGDDSVTCLAIPLLYLANCLQDIQAIQQLT